LPIAFETSKKEMRESGLRTDFAQVAPSIKIRDSFGIARGSFDPFDRLRASGLRTCHTD